MVEDKPHDGCKTKLELTNQEQYLDGKKKEGENCRLRMRRWERKSWCMLGWVEHGNTLGQLVGFRLTNTSALLLVGKP
jgi:chorismate synthase